MATFYDDEEKKNQQSGNNTPAKTPAPPAPTTTKEQTDIINTDNSTDAYLQRQQEISDNCQCDDANGNPKFLVLHICHLSFII